VNTTGWLRGRQLTADGTGIVSHAGVALIRALADNIGLTAGLSKAAGGKRCGLPTGPPAPGAGWASPPILMPLTGYIPGW
jgi:hypothetical protein